MENNEPEVNKRSKWKKKIDFIFNVAGGSIGLGNVWRFPYLCFKNGGGVFLIPYLIFLIGAAVPIFFLEAAVGQVTSRAASKAWNICPLMKGIGYASMVIVFNLNVYYVALLAWSLRYVVASFFSPLPWSSCNNSWNTANCSLFHHNDVNSSSGLNETEIWNTTSGGSGHRVSAVVEYWERGILDLTEGVHNLGSVRPALFLCFAVSWLIVYFSIWKGIKWTSKIIYFTATFPLIMLLILFVRGITLPGAEIGIYYYLKPNVTKLIEPEVWMDAATQVFYSYSLSNGIMIGLGSFNTFHHNLYRDTIVLSFLNSGTSFFAGFSVFTVLGFMAKEQNASIEAVAESGPGLAFIAYPKAVSLMPLPNFWGVLFFLMIFLLGLDSLFVGQETLIISIIDMKPQLFQKKFGREALVGIVSFVQFLFGIIFMTQGGLYVFYMYDNYAAAGWCLFFIGICECVTISWLFGIERFWNVTCRMIKFRPFPWFKYCWAYIAPLLTTAIFIYSLVQYKPLTYNKTYTYPLWAQFFCWCLALCAILWIPGYAVYSLSKTRGNFKEKLKLAISVLDELEMQFTKKENFSFSSNDLSLEEMEEKFIDS